MRKSINVETVTSALVNAHRAKLWKYKVEELVKSAVVASTAYKSSYQQKLKEEIEFANANLDLLSEEDYKWLLEQQKSPTDVIELPPKTHGVRETYNKSDTEIMDKFKSVLSKSSTEGQSTRWIVQIVIGKDTYYRTLRTKNRMSPSIYDAKCYVSENAAKQAIVSVVAENASNPAMSCVLDVKEVRCTETSSRTIEIVKKPKKSMDIDSPEFKDALANAPFVCKTHCDSEEEDLPDSPENHPSYTPSSKHTEIMDEFNKLPPYDSLASDTVKGAINKSDQPIVATESPKLLWVVQVTNGKDIWYKSTKSFKDNCVTSSINDANLYYTKADAEFYAKFMRAHNKGTHKLPSLVKVTVKEVIYTENSSHTVELVKPLDSTIKKIRKSKKVYLIQDKKTQQYVTKVAHSHFTEVDLDKDISGARLYTSKKLADDDCRHLSRYKDTNCKTQLEVVEMPDDEKFVLWSNGSLEFFVRIDSTGIKTTKNLDEATRYVSYKSASTAVKKTDKELPYRFSISMVKNVTPTSTTCRKASY